MKEIYWIWMLLAEIARPLAAPTILYNDNQSVIALARDNQYHLQTKHINIHFHFIPEAMKKGILTIIYCPMDDMVTDILTKALPAVKIAKLSEMLRLGLC